MHAVLISALAALAVAAPLEKRAAINDAQILNYALTLEHLEDTFYRQAIAKFSAADFQAAGVQDPNFYTNLKEISSDEKTHVSFLTGALTSAGYGAVAACTYDFGYTDVQGFLATSSILEGVGVSAYLGAAQNITNKAYLTAAGSILTVEARHSAYIRKNQVPKPESPFPSPFDIPLDFDEVYSLAALFITSCPAGNAKYLPMLKAFPALTLTSGSPVRPGQTITLTSASKVKASHAYFVTITGPVEAKLSGGPSKYEVVVPSGVQSGQEYLVLTCEEGMPTDSTIIAGPAIVEVQPPYTYNASP